MDLIAQSMEKVLKGRDARRSKTVPIRPPEERDKLVHAFHPD